MHVAEELILHVGLAKTGTSAIQEACFAQKQALLATGLLYPGAESNHYHFQSMFADDPHRLIQVARWGLNDRRAERVRIDAVRERFEREVETLRPRRILISSEYIPAMSVAEMRRLSDYLKRFAATVRVLAYLRDPWGMTISVGQEEIRAGLWAGIVKLGYRGDTLPALDRLEQGLGVRLEAQVYQGDVVEGFAEWIGAPLASDKRLANSSIGYETACMLTLLNAYYPQFADGVFNADGARDWMAEAIAGAFPQQRPIRLSRHTAKMILDEAAADIRAIEARYFGGRSVFASFYDHGDFIDGDDAINVARMGPADVAEGLMRAMRMLSERGVYYYHEHHAALARSALAAVSAPAEDAGNEFPTPEAAIRDWRRGAS